MSQKITERWTRVYMKEGGYFNVVEYALATVVDALYEEGSVLVKTQDLYGEVMYIRVSEIQCVATMSLASTIEDWEISAELEQKKNEIEEKAKREQGRW